MAIDPNIPLAVRPPEAPNPLGTLGQIMQLRAMQQQGAAADLSMQEKTRAISDQDKLRKMYRDAWTTTPEGVVTLDRGKLQTSLAQGGLGDKIPEITESLDKADKSTADVMKARAEADAATKNAIGSLMAGVRAAGYTPGAFQSAADHVLQNKLADPQQVQQYLTAAQTGGPEAIKSITDKMIAESEKQTELGNAAKTAESRATAAAKPTEATLAVDAANPNSPTAAQSKAALDAMRAPKAPPSLEEQYLTAKTNGDTQAAARILATLHETAFARRDPAAASLAGELGKLRLDEAQARLDALKEKAKPLDISGSVNTTMSGGKYIDLSEWQTPEERSKAQHAAVAQGIAPVNKDVAGMLSDLDTARQNQQTMMNLIDSKLPKDAAGRVIKGPTNTLEKLAQTDPALASIGTFRNAAIQSMRAVAGSKGLRINQTEVQLAIDNDIPKLSDTLDAAKQKLADLSAFMDNIEKAHLVRDRSAVTGTSALPKPTAITLTPGLQSLKDRK